MYNINIVKSYQPILQFPIIYYIISLRKRFHAKGEDFVSTIEDVAKLAGLSRTTVSRVINNHPYVSDEKKKGFN